MLVLRDYDRVEEPALQMLASEEPMKESLEELAKERHERLWNDLRVDSAELAPPKNPPPDFIVLTELQRSYMVGGCVTSAC